MYGFFFWTYSCLLYNGDRFCYMNVRETAIKMRKQFQMFPNPYLDAQKCASDKPARSWKLWNRHVV